MNGPGTDPAAIRDYEAAIRENRSATLEIEQYRKDGTRYRAMLFASPLDDGQGSVTNHFLSYLDITRRFDAETRLKALAAELEERVAERTRTLEAANDRLTKLAAEREMLLVEVNHRAKNSLSIAGALLRLQGRRHPDPAVTALFDETQERLNAMARAHDLLSRSDHVQQVDAGRYVTDLCTALTAMADGDDRIRLDATVEPGIAISADTAIPARAGAHRAHHQRDQVRLPVRPLRHDRGRAPPGPAGLGSRWRSGTTGSGWLARARGSLGFSLIRSLVQQIDGALDIRGDAGVRVTITFPDLQPAT